MIKQTYICDKCGKEVESESLRHINISITNQYGMDTKKAADWCDGCLHETGIRMSGRLPEPEQEPMTLNDFIAEIVRDEIEYAMNP